MNQPYFVGNNDNAGGNDKNDNTECRLCFLHATFLLFHFITQFQGKFVFDFFLWLQTLGV
jgi:hypothetical protein